MFRTKQCVVPAESLPDLFTSPLKLLCPLRRLFRSAGDRQRPSDIRGRMSFCKRIRNIHWEKRRDRRGKGKCYSASPEPSLLSSSAFSNYSLGSLFEHQGLSESCRRSSRWDRFSPARLLLEDVTFDMKEEDRKILRLMTLRREAAIREEEMAHSLRAIWAKENQDYKKLIEEKRKSWNDYVAQKRKVEDLKHSWRKKNQMDILKEEKIVLESRINEKLERSEKRKNEISYQKKFKPRSVNCMRETMHAYLKKQREWEDDVKHAIRVKSSEDKNRRAEEKLKNILSERLRRIRESSLKREIKFQAAKDSREESNRRAEDVQKENLEREEKDRVLRERRVVDAIEWKKKMALEKNQMKEEYHAFVYKKLKEEEREKEAQARVYLQAKEKRIKAIIENKESAISRSRSNSRMAAYLRQKIKSSYHL